MASEKTKDDLAKMLSIAKQLGYMQSLAEEIPSGEGWRRYTEGATQKFKQFMGENPALDSYEAAREGVMASQAAKTIGSDTGALAEGDVARALKQTPTAWTSKVSEKAIFDSIRHLLEMKTNMDLQPYYDYGRNKRESSR